MRRKQPVTLNLPERLRTVATAYAEANERSFSSLVEHLLRVYLNEKNVCVDLTPEEFVQRVKSKEVKRVEKGPRKKGGDVEL